MLTTNHSIQDEIKSILKSWNACYHLLLSKNIKIRIYRTIILPVVCYGCETS